MELDESSWKFSRTGSIYSDEFGDYEFIKAIGRVWSPMPLTPFEFNEIELVVNEQSKSLLAKQ